MLSLTGRLDPNEPPKYLNKELSILTKHTLRCRSLHHLRPCVFVDVVVIACSLPSLFPSSSHFQIDDVAHLRVWGANGLIKLFTSNITSAAPAPSSSTSTSTSATQSVTPPSPSPSSPTSSSPSHSLSAALNDAECDLSSSFDCSSVSLSIESPRSSLPCSPNGSHTPPFSSPSLSPLSDRHQKIEPEEEETAWEDASAVLKTPMHKLALKPPPLSSTRAIINSPLHSMLSSISSSSQHEAFQPSPHVTLTRTPTLTLSMGTRRIEKENMSERGNETYSMTFAEVND